MSLSWQVFLLFGPSHMRDFSRLASHITSFVTARIVLTVAKFNLRVNLFISKVSCARISVAFVNYGVHYEAKLCILCIVSGIRNRPKSDLLRNPQHCYFSLIFYAVLDSTNKYLNHCTAQNRSKNRQICGILNCICGI